MSGTGLRGRSCERSRREPADRPGVGARRAAAWRLAVLLAGALALTAGCTGGDGPAWQGGNGAARRSRPRRAAQGLRDDHHPRGRRHGRAAPRPRSPSRPEATRSTPRSSEGRRRQGRQGRAARRRQDLAAQRARSSTARRYTATVTATGDDGKPATTEQHLHHHGQARQAGPGEQLPRRRRRGRGRHAADRRVRPGGPRGLPRRRAAPDDRDQRRRSRRASGTGSARTEVHYRPKEFWKAGTRCRTGCRPAACRWATAGTAAPTSRSTSRSARRWS